MERFFLIGDVAKITGISKRKIKYLVEKKIIIPSQQNKNGKKEWLYSEKNIAEIQQVELFRELGYSIEEVSEWVNDPDFDWNEVLPKQIDLLIEKKRHIENLIFAAECIRYISETESEQVWFDISSFDNNIDHFAQDTFIGENDNNLIEQETEKFGKRFVTEFRKMNLDKEVRTSYEMIFSLKKAMEYGPKSQEVQHILEQIFNYYGIVSNKSTFTLDDVLLMYRIIRTFSIDRIISMLLEKPDATNLLESALSKFVVDRKKGGNVDG